MGNVFIIGNGFDLDLGLPTKYSDFAKSVYWPAKEQNNQIDKENWKNDYRVSSLVYVPDTPKLEDAIEDAKSRESWFDLEKELLDYSMQYEPKTSNFKRFCRESQ